MSIFVVVKITDVTGAAVDGATVTAGTNGNQGTATSPTAPAQAGVSEQDLGPSPPQRLNVTVQKKGFFAAFQDLKCFQGSPLPQVQFDGPQHPNVRRFAVVSRGSGDANIEVHFVLGQLTLANAVVRGVDPWLDKFLTLQSDGSTPVPDRLDPANPSSDQFVAPPVSTTVATPILGAKAASDWVRAGVSWTGNTPKGTLLVGQRANTPQLVGVWRPAGATAVNTGTSQGPIDYHVFYHPFIPGTFSRTYPLHFHYTELILRYLFREKRLAHQHELSGKKAILVFPVSSPVDQWNNPTQTSVFRLLQEISYWMPRTLSVSNPLNTVGRVAISFFSAGIRPVKGLLLGTKNVDFYDNHLKELWSWDGVFANDPGGVEKAQFIGAVKTWFRKGTDGRMIRFYSQSDWSALQSDLGSPFVAFDGASEAHGATGTILHAPTPFWGKVSPDLNVDTKQADGSIFTRYDKVHQTIPMVYPEHALANSGLQ